ncbi:hypothetical protein CCACVL1_00271, partial [Corchorus capsularis]
KGFGLFKIKKESLGFQSGFNSIVDNGGEAVG